MYKFVKGPYPSKEEILEDRPSIETCFEPSIIDFCNQWKKDIWQIHKGGKTKERFEALRMLIQEICLLKPKIQMARVRLDENASTPYYIPSNITIFLNKHLSIISALHELGHHLYGESELLACRFSVHLFKEIFPKAFSKLVWTNNMFRKDKDICESAQPALI